MARQYIISIILLSCVHCYAQINNPIFFGGLADGNVSLCHEQAATNAILTGGIGDGSIALCFVQPSTNAIFTGGIGDGNISICYEQIASNAIFTGGIADGNMSICYEQAGSNAIFAGGIGDGNMSICYEQPHSNEIFAGGIGDGYDMGKIGQFPQTIVWQGFYNSDWQLAWNWSPVRIPTIEDDIIIQTINFDPVLSNRVLGIGDQTFGVTEFGRNVFVLQGSTIQMINDSKIRLNNQMNVYGGLISNQSGNETILAMPLSQLNIFPMGEVILRE